ncbi:class I SAM-dependent methyltransferase [Undibacterium griseum]|uniref:Class I SAM-dependent methyltransferase n=1 Tax=Undibacterium griseum TaxID=2762295 RepID=A0ABR6YRY9_9BURK|nr:class I SAM-dependent methyltransferase [Undibacterium griseum]MBC3886664.1 class I SAM-dependent methyltransferase [Undibacterium griseum]
MDLLSREYQKKTQSQNIARFVIMKAMIIQIMAFLFAFFLLFLLKYQFAQIFITYPVFFLPSLLSLWFSIRSKLEWWWHILNFIFPVALIFALYMQLSPLFSLGIFFGLFLIFGATLMTRVPFFPSGKYLPYEIVKIIPDRADIRFLDIGSGFGGLNFQLSTLRSEWNFYGIEVAVFPWLYSMLKSKCYPHRNFEFHFGRYENLNFEKFNVVFAYLSPIVMPQIWKKVQDEMQPGSIFMSYEFAIEDAVPDIKIRLENDDRVLHVWYL